MIVSFTKTSTKTECIWQGLRSERLPPEVQSRALAKLRMLNRAKSLDDLRNPPGNQLHALRNDRAGQHSIRINDQWAYVSVSRTETHTMSKSPTTINPEWLHNSHAGELLVSEFMEPLGLTEDVLACSLAIAPSRLHDVIAGTVPMDAELDLRLARYFRMSDGFFLGLQDDYELLEAKRALNGELDKILPRAA